MSTSPDWYLAEAATYYARAHECRRLAAELDLSPLPDLLSKAGPETWQSPAADDFREQLLVSQGQILDAISSLQTNAYGLSNDGDTMSRAAAVEAERRRQAAAEAAAEARVQNASAGD